MVYLSSLPDIIYYSVQEAITDCVRISHDAMSGKQCHNNSSITPPPSPPLFLPLSARCGSDDGCVDIEKEQVKRAANIVSVMSSAVYSPLVRIVAWLLFWAFGKLFGHLYIQQTHIGMLLNAQEVHLICSLVHMFPLLSPSPL